MQNVETLVAKIQALPPERIAEVEDFVAFIASREQATAASRASGFMSEAAFAAVWDNEYDAAYDAL